MVLYETHQATELNTLAKAILYLLLLLLLGREALLTTVQNAKVLSSTSGTKYLLQTAKPQKQATCGAPLITLVH